MRADQLTAAHGQVRCGECGGLFNALQTLTDRPPEVAFSIETEPAADGEPETSSGEPDVAEAEAGRVNEDDVEAAEAASGDDGDEEDAAAREPVREVAGFAFDLLEDETPRTGAGPSQTRLDRAEPADTADDNRLQADDAALEFNLPPEQCARVFGEQFAPPTARPALATGTVVAREAQATVDDAIEDEDDDIELLDHLGEQSRSRPRLLLLGSLLLTLTLAWQLIYYQREALLLNPATAGYLQRAYRLFGLQPPLVMNLDEYSLTQRGATGTAGEETLTIQASLRNDAARTQPYPLLRVVLEDRWGDEVGVRIFEPGEYLAAKPAPEGLRPGQTADVRLAILDPGAKAIGFDIDLCQRDARNRLSCEDR